MNHRRAIEEILRRKPLMLNHRTAQFDKDQQKPAEFSFADDHLFTVDLPAWVWRELERKEEAT